MQLLYPLSSTSGNIGVPKYHKQEYNKSYAPKDNTNQAPLQYIGNLAYQQGKTATNYVSANSLTVPNHHYTLLYPDLVQELFNFALHNSNSAKNNSLFFGGLGFNNTQSSSLDSSLSSSLNASLSPRDILFFLQIVSLYQPELSQGNSSITYPSLKLAKLLGVDASCYTTCGNSCDNTSVGTHGTNGVDISHSDSSFNTHNATNAVSSLTDANRRATILRMTAKLESLGLLKVFRRKRSNGMDLANKLVPVLPDRLYARIKDLPANLKVSDSSKLDHESNLQHILRTKLFVPIELEFMKSLFKNDLPSKYKLFFLNCIMSAYRNFRHNTSTYFKQDSSDSNSRAEEDINSRFYDSQGNLVDLTNKLSFSSTSRELTKKNDISRSTLDRIFRYIKQQGDNFFLKVEHKYTKSDDIDSNRYDKSIFVISINPLVFPISHISQKSQSQTEEIANLNRVDSQSDESPIFPDTYKGSKTAWSKKQPSIVKKTALNNKEERRKNKYKKNIDDIDANLEDLEEGCKTMENPPTPCLSSTSISTEEPSPTTKNTLVKHKEEFFEDKLCLSSSESYNNSSFLDVSSKNTVLKKRRNQKANIALLTNKDAIAQSAYKEAIEKESEQKSRQEKQKELEKTCLALDKARKLELRHLELRHFYPLAEKDVSKLNSRANREFSTNFVNQLLLKLYIKYPEKRFKNKFTFLSYMEKLLTNEKHQGPLVNHTTFRFSCNIGTEETKLLEYEKYLNQIEHSFDTGKEMQVRKKIAGRFSSEVAYKILTKVQFKTNHDNSFILALIPNRLDLGGNHTECISELQTKILSEQLEAVYGRNGYYIHEGTEATRNTKASIDDGATKSSTEDTKAATEDTTPAIQIFPKAHQGVPLSTIPINTTWHQIRKCLIEEFGEAIDKAWFSKAVVKECAETGLLTLTMPTRFMADWVRNNYSHVIRRLGERCGVNMVEYQWN